MKTIKTLLWAAFTIISVTAFAQASGAKTLTDSSNNTKRSLYCCPTHSDMTSANTGKCPKCGALMNLSPKEKMKMEVMKKYTCPMHPNETGNVPGKCTSCGMDLKPTEQPSSSFSCPMHPGVASDKPGACTLCGMALASTASPKEKMKMDVVKAYCCPMHSEITSKKPGKCKTCGMALVRPE